MDRCIDCGIFLANYGDSHEGEGPLCHLCHKKRTKLKQLKLEEVGLGESLS